MIVIVMGVSGSGKSTVGRMLAGRLGLPFIDADDHHRPESVAQMQRGIPLTDAQRGPWLEELAALLRAHEAQAGVVLACSALREAYRQVLRGGLRQEPEWIFLDGSEAVLRARIAHRAGHFMPETLLRSQLETLEPPAYAHRFSVAEAPEAIVEAASALLQRGAGL